MERCNTDKLDPILLTHAEHQQTREDMLSFNLLHILASSPKILPESRRLSCLQGRLPLTSVLFPFILKIQRRGHSLLEG